MSLQIPPVTDEQAEIMVVALRMYQQMRDSDACEVFKNGPVDDHYFNAVRDSVTAEILANSIEQIIRGSK